MSKAAGKAIEQMGNKLGSLGASLPKYAPIPGLGVSMKGMEKVTQNMEQSVQQRHDKDFKGSKLGKMFGGENAVSEADEKILSRSLTNATT